MKRRFLQLIVLFSIVFLSSCTPVIHHEDPFYDLNGEDYPRGHIPLIKPVQVERNLTSSLWKLELPSLICLDLPISKERVILHKYCYDYVEELEKFAVQGGVILVYSAYTDQQADPFILDNFYHWFVVIPSKYISEGFHTEEEFNQYIQTLDIEDLDWLDPDEVHDAYLKSGGCLEWIPDC